MRKTVIYALLLPIGVFLNGCCTPDPIASSNAVTLHPQETNVWCWAACTQMITEFLGHGRTQCDLANQRFGQSDCCNGNCDQKTVACTQGGWPMYADCGFKFSDSAAALSWSLITSWISCSHQPLGLIDGPLGGGMGHCRVIYGYMVFNGSRFLLLRDPWSPCAGDIYPYSYDDYVNNTTRQLWETDYGFVYQH